jgi:hypothetical protein
MKQSRFTEEQITFARRHPWANCLAQRGTPTNCCRNSVLRNPKEWSGGTLIWLRRN